MCLKHYKNVNEMLKNFQKEELRKKIEDKEAKFETNQCDLQYLDLCRRSNLELRERIHKLVIAFLNLFYFRKFFNTKVFKG
jgi:hypothetical protein